MPTFYLEKNGKKFDVEADSQAEAISKVEAYFADEDMDAGDQALAAGAQFLEGGLGIGDEVGAIAHMGSQAFEVFNTEKSLDEVWNDMSWSDSIDSVREQMDKLDRVNPVLSNSAYGAGMAAGLFVPGAAIAKGATLGKTALTVGAEGAAYGFLSGRDDERVEGAVMGAAMGGALGAGGHKLVAKMENMKKNPNMSAADEAEEIVNDDVWTQTDGNMTAWDTMATGISDAMRRRVSPEAGGRVQRADETAMRQRTKDTAEFLETSEMQAVIKMAEEDKEFKGMLLDFGRHAGDQSKIIGYVREKLGDAEAGATMKYFRWAEVNNARYNKMIGDSSQTGTGYMHTQVRADSVLTGKKSKTPADRVAGAFDDDPYNMPVDAATKNKTRGLASKGEVRVDEYENPFLTNANRIFNNQRLLQLQEKFGVGAVDGGADALMGALEKQMIKKGIDEQSAREGRNAMVSLITGQNKNANQWLRTFQNTVYGATLAGPKSAVLNFHDIPVALFNNGIASAKGLVNKEIRSAADVQRLGIDGQNVGEFVQAMQTAHKKGDKADAAERISRAATDKLMKYSFFQSADRVAKNQVLKTVAQDTLNRAKAGNLSERWGTYFDQGELRRLEGAMRRTGGNIDKMNAKELALYDEVMTLGLGQQQLISAAGRPQKWMDSPNMRPLYMMRGFAIKHNALLSEKVLSKVKKGDHAGAAKEAAAYLALPRCRLCGHERSTSGSIRRRELRGER